MDATFPADGVTRTIQEITEVVGVSHATIERHWKFARAWLFSAVADPEPDSPP